MFKFARSRAHDGVLKSSSLNSMLVGTFAIFESIVCDGRHTGDHGPHLIDG